MGLEGLNLLRINYASEVRNRFNYHYTFTDIISAKATNLEISENVQFGMDTNSPDGEYFPLLTQYTVLSLIEVALSFGTFSNKIEGSVWQGRILATSYFNWSLPENLYH